jgi:transportin-1
MCFSISYISSFNIYRLSFRPEYLKEHMLPISQFILNATGDENEDVALEACEYWLVFSSLDETLCTEEMMDIVGSLLPHLLPTLLKSMVYSEEKKLELLEQNEMDERQNDDRTQDLAPVFHKSKTKGGARDDDGSDEEEDHGNYDEDKEWSLRTCAAASLDSLASGFGSDETFPHLLPLLEQYLSNNDPWIREAGILALGAIEEGCGSEMNEHMHQLHPFLMNQVAQAGNVPQLVCISCWTLGRYASWAVEQTASGAQPELMNNLVNAIISRILDKNRKVQVASVSALCVLIENAGDMVIPYLDPIYRTLVLALEKHSARSLLVALETFGTIAMTLGEASGEGHLPSLYVPPLIRMWFLKAKENPLDRSLLPLLESLSYVTMSIGMSFQPWALETFDGALSTINACMLVLSVSDYSDEEADTIVCAVDVIDGLVEGLGLNFEQLVSSSNQYGDHFLEILKSLVSHDVESVRTSAFALMGDIAKYSPVILQDGMEVLITEAISCIDPIYPSCCNNAVWALGEILVKCRRNPAVLQPYASEIVQNLIVLLTGTSYDEDEEYYPMSGLVENAATTMGRLSQCEPSFVTEDLHRLLNGWIDGCAKISDTKERCDAFEGLLLAIEKNPNVMHPTSPDISNKVTSILFAVVSWHIPENFISSEILHGPYGFTNFPSKCAHLQQNIMMFLHKVKDWIGPELWNSIFNGLPVNVRKLLKDQYGF